MNVLIAFAISFLVVLVMFLIAYSELRWKQTEERRELRRQQTEERPHQKKAA